MATTTVATGARSASPQLERADSAWARGRHAEAVAAYDSVLRIDPHSVRANYRIGVWLCWQGQLDSALVMIRRAREMDPVDGDLMLAEARFLAWDGRLEQAVTLYDTVLARDPERHEAYIGRAHALAWAGHFAAADSTYECALRLKPGDGEALNGRAQVMEWQGDSQAAEALYVFILSRNPDDVDALTGLARLHHQQGRVRSARQELSHALALDPTNRAARRLDLDVRAAYRPQFEMGMTFLSDSDRNAIWSRTASTSLALADGLRGFFNANSAAARDPVRDAQLTTGELALLFTHGRFQITAAGGAHWLASNDASDRTAPAYRGTWSTRFAKRTIMGLGFARHPFDDTAALIAGDIDVDELEASFESRPVEPITLTGGGGMAWLSDGNARRSLVGAVMHEIDTRYNVGVFARGLEYDRQGTGYFSPDRFALAEARGSVSYSRMRWESSTRAGLGWQQVGIRSVGQLEWHVEQSAAFHWASINQITIRIGASNSANSATSGAYSSFTTGLAVRFGI